MQIVGCTTLIPVTVILPLPHKPVMKKSTLLIAFFLFYISCFSQANDPFLIFPIELKYFQAQKTNQSNLLKWLAPCQTTEATFEIQHSTDNRNFTVLESVNADQLRCTQPFDYTDLQRREGTNYYRIRMITPFNSFIHSYTVAVLNASTGFELNVILPSLVYSSAVLSISSAETDRLHIFITDYTGKRYSLQQYQVQSGTNQINLQLNTLPAGQYILTAVNGKGDQRSLRFLKQ